MIQNRCNHRFKFTFEDGYEYTGNKWLDGEQLIEQVEKHGKVTIGFNDEVSKEDKEDLAEFIKQNKYKILAITPKNPTVEFFDSREYCCPMCKHFDNCPMYEEEKMVDPQESEERDGIHED